MRYTIIRLLVGVLLLVGSAPGMWAQHKVLKSQTEFNPTNPPDPNENLYYNVSVSADMPEAAYLYGTGKYLEGTTVTVRYSIRNSNFKFKHWSIDGEEYTTNSSFSYTVGSSDVSIVAHFEYTPTSPSDPQRDDTYKLFLETDTEGACSFNIASGTRVAFDNYKTLTVYVNQGYQFLGWYANGALQSTSTTFNYLMPAEDITLVAKFLYNPTNPDDPESDGTQTDVQTTPTGDINKDGIVDVSDIVALVNRCLDSEATELGMYDVNGDGVVDVSDIVRIINISLNQ